MTSQRSQIINDGAVAGEEEACGKKRHSHSRVVARDATVSYNMGTWYKIVPNVLTVPASLGLVSDGYSLVLYYSTVLLLYSEQGQGGVGRGGGGERNGRRATTEGNTCRVGASTTVYIDVTRTYCTRTRTSTLHEQGGGGTERYSTPTVGAGRVLRYGKKVNVAEKKDKKRQPLSTEKMSARVDNISTTCAA